MSFGIFDSYVLPGEVEMTQILNLLAFGFRTHVLTDPTAFEEPLLDTTISIAMSDSGELISVMQLGLG